MTTKNLILNKLKNYLAPVKNYCFWHRHPLIKENIETSPFFIIGSGRSGTTLLRRLLIQSPGVHIPPETYVLGRMINLYEQNAGMSWPNLVNLMLSTLEYQRDFSTFNITNLQPLAMKLNKATGSKRSLNYIVDQFYRYHAKEQNVKCEVWGDKTPLNTLCVDNISRLFPNAKYVYLVRNGYDVTYSYYKTGLYDNCVEAALRWEKSNKKALGFQKRKPDNVLMVKYEELVQVPHDIVPKVYSFLNLKFESDYIEMPEIKKMGDVEKKKHHYNVQKKINTNSIGKGKGKIPVFEIEKVKQIIEPMNTYLCY